MLTRHASSLEHGGDKPNIGVLAETILAILITPRVKIIHIQVNLYWVPSVGKDSVFRHRASKEGCEIRKLV
jgi:hypothetical protein